MSDETPGGMDPRGMIGLIPQAPPEAFAEILAEATAIRDRVRSQERPRSPRVIRPVYEVESPEDYAERMDRRRDAMRRRLTSAIYQPDTCRLDLLRPQQDPTGKDFDGVATYRNVEHAVTTYLQSDRRNLLLAGPSRHGKTYAAHAVCFAAIDAGLTVLAYPVSNFYKELRPNESDPTRPDYVWEQLLYADIVYLDDLGTEPLKEFGYDRLYSLLEARIAAGKRMVMTTNLRFAELTTFYDRRVTNRMIEGSRTAWIEGVPIDPAPAAPAVDPF